MRPRSTLICLWLFVLSIIISEQTSAAQSSASVRWVRSWGVPVQAPDDVGDFPGSAKEFRNVSIRQIVRATLGGSAFRVLLSNEYGKRPLVIGRARIARAADNEKIEPGSDRALSFYGLPSVTILPGTSVESDPVNLVLPSLGSVAVSIYLPKPLVSYVPTVHPDAKSTTYISGPGDFTQSVAPPITASIQSSYFLSGLDVEAKSDAGVVVTMGDSITDGALSTPNTNRRWPDFLANRLVARSAATPIAVINMGISGNRLLHDYFGPSALSRFDRDVLGVPGIRYIVVLEGINDIGAPTYMDHPEENVSALDMINALQQLRDRAHMHGIKIYGATLTPMGGALPEYDTPEGEIKRLAVNKWLRTSSRFDAIIDFDQAVRDPAQPNRFLPAYDSGDHLHPSDAGDQAMANSIDLKLFQ